MRTKPVIPPQHVAAKVENPSKPEPVPEPVEKPEPEPILPVAGSVPVELKPGELSFPRKNVPDPVVVVEGVQRPPRPSGDDPDGSRFRQWIIDDMVWKQHHKKVL